MSVVVQIQLASGQVSGPGGTASKEGLPPLDHIEGGQEMLDDFLSRLQSIIRRSPASPPQSADDTRPTGRRTRS